MDFLCGLTLLTRCLGYEACCFEFAQVEKTTQDGWTRFTLSWLGEEDSNPRLLIQSQLSYH